MSVRSKGQHPVYKSSAKEGEKEGEKNAYLCRDKGTPNSDFLSSPAILSLLHEIIAKRKTSRSWMSWRFAVACFE